MEVANVVPVVETVLVVGSAVVEDACAAVDDDELVQSMEEQAIHFAVPLHRPLIPLVTQAVPAGAYGHVDDVT